VGQEYLRGTKNALKGDALQDFLARRGSFLQFYHSFCSTWNITFLFFGFQMKIFRIFLRKIPKSKQRTLYAYPCSPVGKKYLRGTKNALKGGVLQGFLAKWGSFLQFYHSFCSTWNITFSFFSFQMKIFRTFLRKIPKSKQRTLYAYPCSPVGKKYLRGTKNALKGGILQGFLQDGARFCNFIIHFAPRGTSLFCFSVFK
jgi:hypothetical protein